MTPVGTMADINARLTHLAKEQHVAWQVMCAMRIVEERNGSIQLRLRTLSREVAISEQYLGKLLREATGLRFREYLRAIRIGRAAKLLLTSTRTAKEIAAEVGYSELANFYHDFRLSTGSTPRRYRTAAYVRAALTESPESASLFPAECNRGTLCVA